MLFRKLQKISNKKKGFTLIELLVVVAIFAVISGVALWNYNRFSSNLVVTNLAYQAALAVRQAQVYGISVKQVKGGTGISADFNAAYGVWFDTDNLQQFILFADKSSDKKYVNDENEETISLNGTNKILKFCVISGVSVHCSGDGLKSISVLFKRPEPNALIYGFNALGTPINGAIDKYDSAEIQFTSGGSGDKIARITVTNTGQISVDSCSSPRGNPCQ